MNIATLALLSAIASAPAWAATTCDSLTSLALPDTAITSAQSVTSGEFALPGRPGGKGEPAAIKGLPSFCRVTATLKPSSDSDIKVEVWLPASGWNGNFEAVGNGGWAGTISYANMADALKEGYATSSTDTGHSVPNGSFALGHPEKLIDFGYRSEHEMTVKAKAVIQAFYGKAPKFSYWNSCSTGGRMGLKEAQLYPQDFDGIIAGDPVNPRARNAAQQMWVALAVHKDEASYIPPEKYGMVHKAVLEACDAIDGLKDGLIQDPTRCHFDPMVLECKGADGPACLTTPQVEAARKILGPGKNPRTGEFLFPGLAPGTELGWRVSGGPEAPANSLDHFKYVVFQNPNWDWRTFNFDADVARTDEADKGLLNATDPNLKPFLSHGKLLQYHGWADPNVAPEFSINYYKKVVDTLGGESKTRDSYRLFMVPGMAHCGGGEGPNVFETMPVIAQWVEKKKAPEQIVASHLTDGKVDRTRPLCPYPQVAKYKGSGSIDDAANFSCKAP